VILLGKINEAQAQTYTVLYTFKALPDAQYPTGLTIDPEGNLYGVTGYGGSDDVGAIFKIDTAGNETVLHSFTFAEGAIPQQNDVSWDASGNLVGTVQFGGLYNCGGTFRWSTDGTYTVRPLTENEGCAPASTLIRGPGGSLYGTAQYGGANSHGTVFRLDAHDNLKVLYNFADDVNGGNPLGTLLRDPAGNLYGVTQKGGGFGCNPPWGCGTVYKLDSTGILTLLHAFKYATGWNAADGLIADPNGSIYGAAVQGGANNFGAIFKMSTDGKYKVLHAFASADGTDPFGLILDKQGNFYGTASLGGTYGVGTVYKLDRYGNFTVLYNFTGGTDGRSPWSALILDGSGNLYGVAQGGGDPTCDEYNEGCGVVFKISFP
jgi:uncharacterized repeat protein (TIGR03803 family)